MKFFIDGEYIWMTTAELYQQLLCYIFYQENDTWVRVRELNTFSFSHYKYTIEDLSVKNKERVSLLLEQLLGDSDV